MENRLARNRKSPKNERELAYAYSQLNPAAKKIGDGLDIAIVKAKDGTNGVGLMDEKFNRSGDKNLHRVKDFIPESVLKSHINSRK